MLGEHDLREGRVIKSLVINIIFKICMMETGRGLRQEKDFTVTGFRFYSVWTIIKLQSSKGSFISLAKAGKYASVIYI